MTVKPRHPGAPRHKIATKEEIQRHKQLIIEILLLGATDSIKYLEYQTFDWLEDYKKYLLINRGEK